MSVKISVNMNTISTAATISKRIDKKAQIALDAQVMKDSNYYAPKRDGYLQSSVIKDSKLGQLVWGVIYAARQYYSNDNKSKDTNPNARYKWFEYAKSKNKDQWVKLANKEYKK